MPLLYVDDEMLAINKPAGLSVTAARDGRESLIEVMRREQPAELLGDVRLVHRLDRETSGVMVLARSLAAQRRLSACFARGQTHKCYSALVRGRPTAEEGLIDLPIGPRRRQPGQMCVDHRHGRPARTAWRVVDYFSGITLLACRPFTGRTHQIRVHLQAAGWPLAVDRVYGGEQPLLLSQFKPGYRPSRRRPERPLIDRLTLHAASLALPGRDRRLLIHVEAAFPRDLRATLNQLRKHGRRFGPSF